MPSDCLPGPDLLIRMPDERRTHDPTPRPRAIAESRHASVLRPDSRREHLRTAIADCRTRAWRCRRVGAV